MRAFKIINLCVRVRVCKWDGKRWKERDSERVYENVGPNENDMQKMST